jgi:O-methyltransferase
MDNAFILDLKEKPSEMKLRRKIAIFLCKTFNMCIPYFKIKYSTEDALKGGMISIEQAMNIYHLLAQTIIMEVPGDIVELGCFEGITTILMQKTLDQHKSDKKIHVYDSFQGLPDKTEKDGKTKFKKGFCLTTKEKLIENFKKFKAKQPHIHEGWFKDTLPTQLPDKISFAHLDGDFYSSIMESLTYVYPKLSKNAIVVIDDYCDPSKNNTNNILPGVKKACDDFFKGKKEKVHVLIAGNRTHGYFKKC